MSDKPTVVHRVQSHHQSKAITWRYWCMRITSCPCPFLPASFPIIGGHSLIEVLCIILLFAIAILLCLSASYEGAGKIGDLIGGATTVLGLRNNLLSLVLGISYERALFWHKAMGFAFIIAIVIHFFCGMNFSGIMMLGSMIAMAATYFIKNKKIPHAFEIFYYVHLGGMILLCLMGILHGTPFILISGGLWLLDVFCRSSAYVQSETITAKATQLPGEVIKLTFERPIRYEAGQYAFVRIPVISMFEFHPFSFSSAPHEEYMTIHIRELGDWTKRLGDMVRAHDKTSPAEPLQLEVMLDGSYGKHMINLESPEYKVFLLISGGIGITPNQSLYNKLIAQSEEQRALRKVFFIWSVKDKALVNTMTPDMLESKKLSADHTPLSFQPGMMGLSEKVIAVKPKSVAPTAGKKESQVGTEPANVDAPDTNDASGDVVFENRFYLTRVRAEDEFQQANINPVAQPWLKFGRPDMAALFAETTAMLLKDKEKGLGESGIPRVAVSVCGPTGLVNDVQDLCRKSQSMGSAVRFDCHAEVFDM